MLLVLLLACTPDESHATWLQGAGYGWDLFNHRLSHLELGVDDGGAWAAVVGGTSTTGVDPKLPPSCNPDTCEELPFLDSSLVEVQSVALASTRLRLGQATATLLAGAEGADTTVQVPLPDKARGTPVAMLASLALDTDQPLTGGEACYDPAYGWHPRRIMVTLGAPTLAEDGRAVTVPVQAAFEAGESLEEIRQCIDLVNDQAQVAFTVGVAVAVGPDETQALDVAMTASYAYGDGPADPDEQPAPDLADRPLAFGIDAGTLGWSRLDWRFHQEDAQGRGAYLRTLSFAADAQQGWASGHATNYSPITQLTGFDYRFEGTVVGLVLDGDVAETRTWSGELPAELDEAGDPVVFDLE